MSRLEHNPPFGGAFSRRFTRYSGLYFDEFSPDSAWIRESAVIRLPPVEGLSSIVVRGKLLRHPEARWPETGFPSLEILLDGASVARIPGDRPGPWEVRLSLEKAPAQKGSVLLLVLHGVRATNALAWLGRVTALGPFQRYRSQRRNRQLRICSVETGTGENIYDFSRREGPYSVAFARLHCRIGMNVVGFLTADLGIGESARCMVRAADAASVPVALVPLKLNCKNRLGDQSFSGRLQDSNPYGANVFHIDPPVSRDIDHHHGPGFRKNRYNIGFFAWELTDFPDAWLAALDYYDEIWCPSNFVRESIALKALYPVLTMPHSIAFERPSGGRSAMRAQFGLPAEGTLFLTLFDLNSYSNRKNPQAVVEAFRMSGLAGSGAALVIKVQNAEANAAEFAALQALAGDIPGTVILSGTLSRPEVYALEAACDCFVSLHRAEGFGLAVAECMYLGKPVISTNWSATSEYLNHDNGYPVRYRLVELTDTHGPYVKGARWADPDPSHAAELMRGVVADPAKAAAMGAAARATIEERFSPAAVGALYRRRLETIASL